MRKIWFLVITLVFSLTLIGCKEEAIPPTPTPPIEEKPIDPGAPIDPTTRTHATYYTPGTALVDDSHVVYINFDGFARYYLDEFLKDTSYDSTIKKLMTEGTFFEDLRTTLPSITNPLQNMILSGSTSAITKNVYRYFDRTNNVVVQQGRENAAPRITKLAIDANIPTASVAHYLAGEDGYSPVDTNKLYINADNTLPPVVQRGSEKNNDYFARFEQAIKLIKGQPITTYQAGNPITVSKLPKFLLIYCDDLDALGHNEKSNYGYPLATTEKQRVSNVLDSLKGMDQKLGELIQAAKDRGIYDKMTFFLTTDHGMAGFGDEVKGETSPYRTSKWGALRTELRQFNPLYTAEFVAAGSSPQASTNVVAVGMNLNLQLTFKKDITDEALDKLKQYLLTLDYVANVLTRSELEKMGYWTYAADMIISPSERYAFSSNILGSYTVRGQHDTLLDAANRVVGLAWGKGIKQNYIYQGEAYNYDFGVMMAATLGLQFPNANGIVLDIFERD